MTTNESVRINNSLNVTGTIGPPRPRTELATEPGAVYPVPLTDFRVWDAMATVLPGTSATDDLGVTSGTWGTHAPIITTGDFKTTSITRRARVSIQLPVEYVTRGAVAIRLSAGMQTTVAGTSCTVGVEAILDGRDGTIDGADLVTTAAQNMNSLTFADFSFAVTSADLAPGDTLDVRITVAGVDAAAVTAVIASIGAVELLVSIRG